MKDPLRGGKDEMLQDITAVIHANDEKALAQDARAPPRRRLVPEFMLKLAHKRGRQNRLAAWYRLTCELDLAVSA
ncbi:putative isoprenylcysteine alpha-carbonyl methylesterase icmel2 [Asimina triloba]